MAADNRIGISETAVGHIDRREQLHANGIGSNSRIRAESGFGTVGQLGSERTTCGGFTPEGTFLELPEFDMNSQLPAWQEAVFALYLAEGKIESEVVQNMRNWEHSGFSVDQSVLLSAGDEGGIERLVQYMVRCPFSLSRLVKVTD